MKARSLCVLCVAALSALAIESGAQELDAASIQSARLMMVSSIKNQGVEAELHGDTLQTSLRFKPRSIEGQAQLAATEEERRAMMAAKQLLMPAEQMRQGVNSYKMVGLTHIAQSLEYADGRKLVVTLGVEELSGLLGPGRERWQVPMRGYLRRLTEAYAAVYPQDEKGKTLRGEELAQARRTTDDFQLTPLRLQGNVLYEVYSKPRITPQDVADRKLSYDMLARVLAKKLPDWRFPLSMAYLANVDYCLRYEAPDGAAYEYLFPAEMVQRVFGCDLRGESQGASGAEGKVSGESYETELRYPAGDATGLFMAQATSAERRAFLAANHLSSPPDELDAAVADLREKGVKQLVYTMEIGVGLDWRVTLGLDELLGLRHTVGESWRVAMRGALRRLSDVCEVLYPQDGNGKQLRGAALAAARCTTEDLLLTPVRMLGGTCYEVYSTPKIGAEELAYGSMDYDTRVGFLKGLVSEAEGRPVIARAYLANIDYALRYEAPDGSAYEIRFPAEMIQRVYGKFLRGEQ